MNERHLFYIAIAAIIGITIIIGSCTYQTGSCRKEAIKANVNPEHIGAACSIK